MKIYTKTGDEGKTGVLGGIRVSKSHQVISVCGSLDETNSLIGLARSFLDQSTNLGGLLGRIQNDLFDLGSQVAGCLGESQRPPEFPESRVLELEQQIDEFQTELPPLTAFILPGGNQGGSVLHLARSVCRRAERDLVQLIESLNSNGKTDTAKDATPRLGTEMVYLCLLYTSDAADE